MSYLASYQGTKLVERYLQEAKFWLPPAQRQDILAELAEDIRSQMEEREEQLGRPLEETELVEILRKRGHPIEVAGKYSPQGHLIGPVFYPLYTFVLKLVILWIIPPAFLLIVAPIIWVADPTPGPALVGLVFRIPQAAFTAFAVITLIFALVERHKLPGYTWDPNKLPRLLTDLEGQGEVSRFTSATRFFSGVFWSSVWLYAIWFQPAVHIDRVTIALTPIWRSLFWAILLALLSVIALSWVNLVRPNWTRLRARIGIGINAYGLVMVGILLAARKWIDISAPDLPQVTLENANRGSNIGLGIALAVVGSILVGGAVVEVRRLLRARAAQPGAPANGLPDRSVAS